MGETVGVRALRQDLRTYLDRVKAGEDVVVTEHGRFVPAGASADAYAELAARFGANVPVEPLEAIARRLTPPGVPAGITDAYVAESRTDRAG